MAYLLVCMESPGFPRLLGRPPYLLVSWGGCTGRYCPFCGAQTLSAPGSHDTCPAQSYACGRMQCHAYHRFPFYQEVKLALVIWLGLGRGAQVVYKKLAPLLLKHEGDIDAAIALDVDALGEDTKAKLQALYEKHGKKALDSFSKKSQ